jgi:hypothetical protein
MFSMLKQHLEVEIFILTLRTGQIMIRFFKSGASGIFPTGLQYTLQYLTYIVQFGTANFKYTSDKYRHLL